MLSKPIGFVRTHPLAIDFMIILATVIQTALVSKKKIPNLWRVLTDMQPPERVETLYLSALGTAAIVSGFAGVVVIFALSASGRRFAVLRAKGGQALKSNWLSTTSSGLQAVLAFTLAEILSLIDHSFLSPYLFQVGLLLLIHSSVRLIWLLSELADVVVAEDVTTLNNENQPKSANELFD